MDEHNSSARYAPAALRNFAGALFGKAGMDFEKAETVAALLVEADLMGHTTHGLALAAPYLEEIARGALKVTGELEIISDRGACFSWDGKRLPGVWLTAKAIDLAVERVNVYGTVTAVFGNSHHIGCLATYLERATSKGFVVILACSDPALASVAPFGGRRAVFTPDPIAVGIPTDGEPILIDTSASITTNAMSNRLANEGRRFPHAWLLDATGQPTDDPAVLKAAGTILPAGGLDHGQKGYNLALMVEALTQGLSGFGRSTAPTGWSASVFIQVIDPAAFGGGSTFRQQMGWLAEECRTNPPRPGVDRVRLPGEKGLANRRLAYETGVRLYPGIIEKLRPWAEKLDVPLPVGLLGGS